MLNAGMYRGRIGDRAYFAGLASARLASASSLSSVYAGAGAYRGPYAQTSSMSGLRTRQAAVTQAFGPLGMHLGGLSMGSVQLSQGPRGPVGVRPRMGATFLSNLRNFSDQRMPLGVNLAGTQLSGRPLGMRYVRLPDGRYILRV